MKIFKLALDIVNSLVALLYSLVLATLTSFGQLIDILFKPYSDLDVKNYLISGCVLSGISFVVFVLSIIDIAAIKNKKVYTAFEIGINITLLAVPVTISYIITRSIWAMVVGFGDMIGLLRANAIMIIITLVLTIPTALISKSK